MSSGEINNMRIVKTEDSISKNGFDNSSAKWVNKNSVLIALAGQGKTRGMVAVNEIKLTTNQSIAAIQPNCSLYYEFLFHNLGKRYEELRLISSGDGTRGGLNKKIISELNIFAPSYTEQKNIGILFKQIDLLITLHQRKLEQLEELKNTLLSKMFPKSGTNIPEIRFSGFTDAWKQRKLEYFLEVSNEKNTDNLYSKENVLSVSGDFGVVNQIEFQGRSFAGVSVTNYGVLNTGDVVYTKSPLKANPYGIIKTNKGQPGIVSSLYGIYHTKEITVADFVQIYFEQNARLNNYLRPLVNKGAKNTILISDTEALKGRVCFAPTYEEQYIIATLFNHLDKLITFHQRNLDNLKKHEKNLTK